MVFRMCSQNENDVISNDEKHWGTLSFYMKQLATFHLLNYYLKTKLSTVYYSPLLLYYSPFVEVICITYCFYCNCI